SCLEQGFDDVVLLSRLCSFASFYAVAQHEDVVTDPYMEMAQGDD
ncbi:unnamed protein product, partial [Musa acuminata subsp. burmannicoides]